MVRPVLTCSKGRIAIVTDVGRGCDGRIGAIDERAPMRTAKACGPDPPTLGSSRARQAMSALTGPTRRHGDGGYQARYTGESAR